MAAFLAAAILAAMGCAGGRVEGDLRINDVQVIGTHNSYKWPLPPDELAAHRARDPAGADSIDYGFTSLTDQLDQGVRQIELDVYDDPQGGRYLNPPGALRKGFSVPPWPPEQRDALASPGFKVMHLPDIDFRSSCVTWKDCLKILRTWSRAHPKHVPLLILVNAKDGRLGPGSAQPLPFNEAVFDRLDAETREVFTADELIAPDDVQGKHPTLRHAALAGGWPTLDEARGRVMFVLDEGPAKVAAYRGRRRSLEGRVMFVSVNEASPLASILVINDPVAERARIGRAVAAGFLVRTRADADTREARLNDTKRRDAALESGAQFVSTDYIDPDARFSGYQVRLPDRSAVRLNPLRVPGACKSPPLEPTPDVVLRGTLTGADHQTYRLVPFTVRPGTTRITVDFDYTAREERTTIDLGLLGPNGFQGPDGFRGWSGGNKRTFTISTSDATPSYLPGPIHAGEWNLLLGIPNIRPDTHADFTATVHFDVAERPVLKREAGWYRGDLHMHTAHSDGSCTSHSQKTRVPCPLFLTAQAASARGLDFIAITDHNTVSHAEPMRELQPYFDDLLLIPGREVTTFQGHANLFGTLATLDFRVGTVDVPEWEALLSRIEGLGGVLSINHPVRPSGEQCMGCGWRPSVPISRSRVQAIEVVNGRDADTEYSGIPFWEKWLNAGDVLTGIGGSDNHDALLSDGVGVPTTVVYADSLSEPGILAALRRGRVFIDVAGTRDRTLDVIASVSRQQAYMGDYLRVKHGETVKFTGSVTAMEGGEVEVILDGKDVPLLASRRIDSATWAFQFDWRGDGSRHWIRLNVRDRDGHLALVGNPVYLRPR